MKKSKTLEYEIYEIIYDPQADDDTEVKGIARPIDASDQDDIGELMLDMNS